MRIGTGTRQLTLDQNYGTLKDLGGVFILNALAGAGALFNMFEACSEILTNNDWAIILLLRGQIAFRRAQSWPSVWRNAYKYHQGTHHRNELYSCQRPPQFSAGTPRTVSGSYEIFFWAPTKGGQAKNLYTTSERLIFSCRVNWAWYERVTFYIRQIVILPRKTNHIKHNRSPVPLPDGRAAVAIISCTAPSRQHCLSF